MNADRGKADRTVLVIEDDEAIVDLLRFILEREGFRLHVALDLRQAEALIATLPPPSLVTLDVMMPSGEGYDLLPRIRAQPDWAEVPVLMLSARAMKRDLARGKESGVDDYLVKPFSVAELRERIQRLVK